MVLISENKFFSIRDAGFDDIKYIYELGELLNSLNLPNDKNELEKIIIKSEESFSDNNSLKEREFLFVMVNEENKVIGCSQIFAKHGTLLSPHLFFQVSIEEHYSRSLNKYFRHQTLKLGQNFDGPTEIGSLILKPAFRGHRLHLGKFLSYVRFLFMAMKKEYFSKNVIAELLPTFAKKNSSALWDALGSKFTGLSYKEADRLSRHDKDFIISLFPKWPIYVSLLPLKAQSIIGQVGEASKGAQILLSQIGFCYNDQIDPFDGGPHFVADLEEISLIKNAKTAKFKLKNLLFKQKSAILACFNPKNKSTKRFFALNIPYDFDDNILFLAPHHYKIFADIDIENLWFTNL